MNTRSENINNFFQNPPKDLACKILMPVLLVAVAGNSSAKSLEKYYENLLLNPDKQILLAEKKGRVTIYDGLDSRLVTQALDTQFHRIENMMFVRTKVILDDASEEADDDCDD